MGGWCAEENTAYKGDYQNPQPGYERQIYGSDVRHAETKPRNPIVYVQHDLDQVPNTYTCITLDFSIVTLVPVPNINGGEITINPGVSRLSWHPHMAQTVEAGVSGCDPVTPHFYE